MFHQVHHVNRSKSYIDLPNTLRSSKASYNNQTDSMQGIKKNNMERIGSISNFDESKEYPDLAPMLGSY